MNTGKRSALHYPHQNHNATYAHTLCHHTTPQKLRKHKKLHKLRKFPLSPHLVSNSITIITSSHPQSSTELVSPLLSANGTTVHSTTTHPHCPSLHQPRHHAIFSHIHTHTRPRIPTHPNRIAHKNFSTHSSPTLKSLQQHISRNKQNNHNFSHTSSNPITHNTHHNANLLLNNVISLISPKTYRFTPIKYYNLMKDIQRYHKNLLDSKRSETSSKISKKSLNIRDINDKLALSRSFTLRQGVRLLAHTLFSLHPQTKTHHNTTQLERLFKREKRRKSPFFFFKSLKEYHGDDDISLNTDAYLPPDDDLLIKERFKAVKTDIIQKQLQLHHPNVMLDLADMTIESIFAFGGVDTTGEMAVFNITDLNEDRDGGEIQNGTLHPSGFNDSAAEDKRFLETFFHYHNLYLNNTTPLTNFSQNVDKTGQNITLPHFHWMEALFHEVYTPSTTSFTPQNRADGQKLHNMTFIDTIELHHPRLMHDHVPCESGYPPPAQPLVDIEVTSSDHITPTKQSLVEMLQLQPNTFILRGKLPVPPTPVEREELAKKIKKEKKMVKQQIIDKHHASLATSESPSTYEESLGGFFSTLKNKYGQKENNKQNKIDNSSLFPKNRAVYDNNDDSDSDDDQPLQSKVRPLSRKKSTDTTPPIRPDLSKIGKKSKSTSNSSRNYTTYESNDSDILDEEDYIIAKQHQETEYRDALFFYKSDLDLNPLTLLQMTPEALLLDHAQMTGCIYLTKALDFDQNENMDKNVTNDAFSLNFSAKPQNPAEIHKKQPFSSENSYFVNVLIPSFHKNHILFNLPQQPPPLDLNLSISDQSEIVAQHQASSLQTTAAPIPPLLHLKYLLVQEDLSVYHQQYATCLQKSKNTSLDSLKVRNHRENDNSEKLGQNREKEGQDADDTNANQKLKNLLSSTHLPTQLLIQHYSIQHSTNHKSPYSKRFTLVNDYYCTKHNNNNIYHLFRSIISPNYTIPPSNSFTNADYWGYTSYNLYHNGITLYNQSSPELNVLLNPTPGGNAETSFPDIWPKLLAKQQHMLSLQLQNNNNSDHHRSLDETDHTSHATHQNPMKMLVSLANVECVIDQFHIQCGSNYLDVITYPDHYRLHYHVYDGRTINNEGMYNTDYETPYGENESKDHQDVFSDYIGLNENIEYVYDEHGEPRQLDLEEITPPVQIPPPPPEHHIPVFSSRLPPYSNQFHSIQQHFQSIASVIIATSVNDAILPFISPILDDFSTLQQESITFLPLHNAEFTIQQLQLKLRQKSGLAPEHLLIYHTSLVENIEILTNEDFYYRSKEDHLDDLITFSGDKSKYGQHGSIDDIGGPDGTQATQTSTTTGTSPHEILSTAPVGDKAQSGDYDLVPDDGTMEIPPSSTSIVKPVKATITTDQSPQPTEREATAVADLDEQQALHHDDVSPPVVYEAEVVSDDMDDYRDSGKDYEQIVEIPPRDIISAATVFEAMAYDERGVMDVKIHDDNDDNDDGYYSSSKHPNALNLFGDYNERHNDGWNEMFQNKNKKKGDNFDKQSENYQDTDFSIDDEPVKFTTLDLEQEDYIQVLKLNEDGKNGVGHDYYSENVTKTREKRDALLEEQREYNNDYHNLNNGHSSNRYFEQKFKKTSSKTSDSISQTTNHTDKMKFNSNGHSSSFLPIIPLTDAQESATQDLLKDWAEEMTYYHHQHSVVIPPILRDTDLKTVTAIPTDGITASETAVIDTTGENQDIVEKFDAHTENKSTISSHNISIPSQKKKLIKVRTYIMTRSPETDQLIPCFEVITTHSLSRITLPPSLSQTRSTIEEVPDKEEKNHQSHHNHHHADNSDNIDDYSDFEGFDDDLEHHTPSSRCKSINIPLTNLLSSVPLHSYHCHQTIQSSLPSHTSMISLPPLDPYNAHQHHAFSLDQRASALNALQQFKQQYNHFLHNPIESLRRAYPSSVSVRLQKTSFKIIRLHPDQLADYVQILQQNNSPYTEYRIPLFAISLSARYPAVDTNTMYTPKIGPFPDQNDSNDLDEPAEYLSNPPLVVHGNTTLDEPLFSTLCGDHNLTTHNGMIASLIRHHRDDVLYHDIYAQSGEPIHLAHSTLRKQTPGYFPSINVLQTIYRLNQISQFVGGYDDSISLISTLQSEGMNDNDFSKVYQKIMTPQLTPYEQRQYFRYPDLGALVPLEKLSTTSLREARIPSILTDTQLTPQPVDSVNEPISILLRKSVKILRQRSEHGSFTDDETDNDQLIDEYDSSINVEQRLSLDPFSATKLTSQELDDNYAVQTAMNTFTIKVPSTYLPTSEIESILLSHAQQHVKHHELLIADYIKQYITDSSQGSSVQTKLFNFFDLSTSRSIIDAQHVEFYNSQVLPNTNIIAVVNEEITPLVDRGFTKDDLFVYANIKFNVYVHSIDLDVTTNCDPTSGSVKHKNTPVTTRHRYFFPPVQFLGSQKSENTNDKEGESDHLHIATISAILKYPIKPNANIYSKKLLQRFSVLRLAIQEYERSRGVWSEPLDLSDLERHNGDNGEDTSISDDINNGTDDDHDDGEGNGEDDPYLMTPREKVMFLLEPKSALQFDGAYGFPKYGFPQYAPRRAMKMWGSLYLKEKDLFRLYELTLKQKDSSLKHLEYANLEARSLIRFGKITIPTLPQLPSTSTQAQEGRNKKPQQTGEYRSIHERIEEQKYYEWRDEYLSKTNRYISNHIYQIASFTLEQLFNLDITRVVDENPSIVVIDISSNIIRWQWIVLLLESIGASVQTMSDLINNYYYALYPNSEDPSPPESFITEQTRLILDYSTANDQTKRMLYQLLNLDCKHMIILGEGSSLVDEASPSHSSVKCPTTGEIFHYHDSKVGVLSMLPFKYLATFIHELANYANLSETTLNLANNAGNLDFFEKFCKKNQIFDPPDNKNSERISDGDQKSHDSQKDKKGTKKSVTDQIVDDLKEPLYKHIRDLSQYEQLNILFSSLHDPEKRAPFWEELIPTYHDPHFTFEKMGEKHKKKDHPDTDHNTPSTLDDTNDPTSTELMILDQRHHPIHSATSIELHSAPTLEDSPVNLALKKHMLMQPSAGTTVESYKYRDTTLFSGATTLGELTAMAALTFDYNQVIGVNFNLPQSIRRTHDWLNDAEELDSTQNDPTPHRTRHEHTSSFNTDFDDSVHHNHHNHHNNHHHSINRDSPLEDSAMAQKMFKKELPINWRSRLEFMNMRESVINEIERTRQVLTEQTGQPIGKSQIDLKTWLFVVFARGFTEYANQRFTDQNTHEDSQAVIYPINIPWFKLLIDKDVSAQHHNMLQHPVHVTTSAYANNPDESRNTVTRISAASDYLSVNNNNTNIRLSRHGKHQANPFDTIDPDLSIQVHDINVDPYEVEIDKLTSALRLVVPNLFLINAIEEIALPFLSKAEHYVLHEHSVLVDKVDNLRPRLLCDLTSLISSEPTLRVAYEQFKQLKKYDMQRWWISYTQGRSESSKTQKYQITNDLTTYFGLYMENKLKHIDAQMKKQQDLAKSRDNLHAMGRSMSNAAKDISKRFFRDDDDENDHWTKKEIFDMKVEVINDHYSTMFQTISNDGRNTAGTDLTNGHEEVCNIYQYDLAFLKYFNRRFSQRIYGHDDIFGANGETIDKYYYNIITNNGENKKNINYSTFFSQFGSTDVNPSSASNKLTNSVKNAFILELSQVSQYQAEYVLCGSKLMLAIAKDLMTMPLPPHVITGPTAPRKSALIIDLIRSAVNQSTVAKNVKKFASKQNKLNSPKIGDTESHSDDNKTGDIIVQNQDDEFEHMFEYLPSPPLLQSTELITQPLFRTPTTTKEISPLFRTASALKSPAFQHINHNDNPLDKNPAHAQAIAEYWERYNECLDLYPHDTAQRLWTYLFTDPHKFAFAQSPHDPAQAPWASVLQKRLLSNTKGGIHLSMVPNLDVPLDHTVTRPDAPVTSDLLVHNIMYNKSFLSPLNSVIATLPRAFFSNDITRVNLGKTIQRTLRHNVGELTRVTDEKIITSTTSTNISFSAENSPATTILKQFKVNTVQIGGYRRRDDFNRNEAPNFHDLVHVIQDTHFQTNLADLYKRKKYLDLEDFKEHQKTSSSPPQHKNSKLNTPPPGTHEFSSVIRNEDNNNNNNNDRHELAHANAHDTRVQYTGQYLQPPLSTPSTRQPHQHAVYAIESSLNAKDYAEFSLDRATAYSLFDHKQPHKISKPSPSSRGLSNKPIRTADDVIISKQ